MSLLSVGVDVPVSQMPAGMAFDSPTSGSGGIGQSILGGIGEGILSGLESFGERSPGGYGGSDRRSTYSDKTRDMLSYLIREAIDSFEPAKSTIS